ncbi:hypothetical protein AABB24_038027 [Solanum stoloniferum]
MQRERDTLSVARVIGDVLDPFTRSINLRVVYNNREVRNGCDLRPSMVINQPTVEIGGDDLQTFYTLVYHIYTIYIQLYTYYKHKFHCFHFVLLSFLKSSFLILMSLRRGTGPLKKYCRKVIRYDMTHLQLTKNTNLDRKIYEGR